MDELFRINETLIGSENQRLIKTAKVAIVGVGGLGCCVLQSLVRLGVTNMTLIDADHVEDSNLQRQVLFTEKDVGKFKVETAKEKLSLFSKHLNISTFIENLNSKNGTALLKDHDVVFDCTDNFTGRYTISKACKTLNIPVIYGGVNAFEGQVGVFNYKSSKAFHEAFPAEKALLETETCEASGVLVVVVQIIANYQAVEFFKLRTNQKALLNNKLLCVNILSGNQRIIKLN